jgi:nitrogen fixation protein NifQ
MSTTSAPDGWAEHDARLYARVAEHVTAAIGRGDLPAVGAGAPPLLPQIHGLLMTERAFPDDAHARLADWFASASMGSHHLWQDLGVQARPEVSRLLSLAFPALFASNTHNLRWKRHLFLSLGQSLGQPGLRPPKCDHCEDFEVCMGMPAPPTVVTIKR